MFAWESKYGTIKVNPDGLVIAEEAVAQWEETNPTPEPPLVPITPEKLNHTQSYNAVNLAQQRNIPIHEAEEIVCRQIGDISDPKDETYLKVKQAWETDRAIFFQSKLIDNCCAIDMNGTMYTYREVKQQGLIKDALKMDDTVPLVQTLADREESSKLYKTIVTGSVLTWENVLEAGREIGIQRGGKPILEVSQATSGGEAQPLNGLLHMSASMFNIVDVSMKPIAEQAHILALYLIKSWLTHYEYEDIKNNK